MKRLFPAILVLALLGPLTASAQARIDGTGAKALVAQDKSVVILDVRTKEEWDGGHLATARLLPYDRIDAKKAAAAIPSKATRVVVYCRSGRRSAVAAQTLQGLGYTAVVDLGAVTNWPDPLVRSVH